MKVGVSSQADIMGELAEFASHPLWRNIFDVLTQYGADLQAFAANSSIQDFAYNKGKYHGTLALMTFLQTKLDEFKG